MIKGKRRIEKKLGIGLGSLAIILVICFLVLKGMYSLTDTTLYGKWRSTETGQIVCFTEDEKVTFEGDLPSGYYHILSPGKIEYTIDHKTFQMIYRIEDNKLYWGVDETHLEKFDKTWF